MFTQLHFSADQVGAQVALTVAALGASLPQAEPGNYAARVIAQRLRIHPEAYIEFGPYWWSVKQVLRLAGEDFGAEDNELLRAAYGGSLPALDALVAGEMFKDYYRRTFLVGASQFWLDDAAEESYVLFDANMEARRTGPGGLKVAADMQAVALPPDPENAY